MNWRNDKLQSPKKYQVSDEVEAESGSRVDSDMTSQQENGARRVRSIRTEEVGSEFYMPTNEVSYTIFFFQNLRGFILFVHLSKTFFLKSP